MRTLRKGLLRPAAACLAGCIPMLNLAPVSTAEDPLSHVTYEVLSSEVGSARVEYQGSDGRVVLHAALPWRTDVPVRSWNGPPPDGSQVRADWRPVAAPRRWVTVRIFHEGELICQSTLDIGNATCYGITKRIS